MSTKDELLPSSQHDAKLPVVRSAVGYSVEGDDMHWTVSCPECNNEFEYEGYFDSSDITKCKCGCVFRTDKVWINDEMYIQ